MTLSKFEDIIQDMIKHNEFLDKCYDLKIDILEACEDQESAITKLWEEVLTIEGADWLWWYLYEKDGIKGKPRKDMKAWDDEKKEICKDIKSLWKYLTKSKYFKTQAV